MIVVIGFLMLWLIWWLIGDYDVFMLDVGEWVEVDVVGF